MEDIHVPFADGIKPLDRWTAYMWCEATCLGLSRDEVSIGTRKGKSLIIFKTI